MQWFTLKIVNTSGEIFELTHSTKNYVVKKISGLTRPTTNINTSTGAGDGTYYNSSKLQQRNIIIDLVIRGDIESNRQRLYRIFPLKTACTVYFQNHNRSVKIQGYVETLDGDLFVDREEIQISIICPRPYFEALDTVYTELSKIVRMFEFPFCIEVGEPIPFSEITSIPSCEIVNTGDTTCGLILDITISGEIQNFRISHTNTGQFMGFDYVFQAGDQIRINTLSGQKKMTLFRGSEEINLLAYMSPGSSWLQLAVGYNEYVSAANNDNLVKIQITTTELFGGV